MCWDVVAFGMRVRHSGSGSTHIICADHRFTSLMMHIICADHRSAIAQFHVPSPRCALMGVTPGASSKRVDGAYSIRILCSLLEPSAIQAPQASFTQNTSSTTQIFFGFACCVLVLKSTSTRWKRMKKGVQIYKENTSAIKIGTSKIAPTSTLGGGCSATALYQRLRPALRKKSTTAGQKTLI